MTDLKIFIALLMGVAFGALHLNRSAPVAVLSDDEPLVSQYVQALPDFSQLAPAVDYQDYSFVDGETAPPVSGNYPTYDSIVGIHYHH